MKRDLRALIYAIIILFLVMILTFAFSPVLSSIIDTAIIQSNHYGFLLDAEVLSALLVIVDLHDLLIIFGEIFGTAWLLYKSHLQ